MWPFSKKDTDNIPKNIDPSKLEVNKPAEKLNETEEGSKLYREIQKLKKEALPKDALTREEALKEFEKLIRKENRRDSNPFKTREDMYFCFWDTNWEPIRLNVPFEEVRIGGKRFFINKKYEDGRISITEMYAHPDIEINLKDEWARQNTTKKQLEKVNQTILYIKNKISEGNEAYALFDIEDLKEEKWRLEKILDSIKYGKEAIFRFPDTTYKKKAYWLRFINGEYRFLKTTELNYMVEENNIRFVKGYDIQKRLEDVVNLRITQNWKDIIWGIVLFICFMAFLWSCYEVATFDEELLDKRVQLFCGGQKEHYEEMLENYDNIVCQLTQNTTSTNGVRHSYEEPIG